MDYLGIYALFGLGQAVTTIIASLFLFMSTLNGARALHNLMFENILRTPLSFFDTTPQGRIINRFGKDVDVLDTKMSNIFKSTFSDFLSMVSTFVVISYTTPVFLIPVTIIMLCYYIVQKIYISSAR